MAYTPHSPKWTPVTGAQAHDLTCSTFTPGVVYPAATSSLPAPLQRMPGVYSAYRSGYCETYKDRHDVAVQGELIVARSGEGTGKGYVYFFGVSESTVQFAGPYKPYGDRYFDPALGVPVEKLFGVSPPPDKKKDA